jgi:hypothetical protein
MSHLVFSLRRSSPSRRPQSLGRQRRRQRTWRRSRTTVRSKCRPTHTRQSTWLRQARRLTVTLLLFMSARLSGLTYLHYLSPVLSCTPASQPANAMLFDATTRCIVLVAVGARDRPRPRTGRIQSVPKLSCVRSHRRRAIDRPIRAACHVPRSVPHRSMPCHATQGRIQSCLRSHRSSGGKGCRPGCRRHSSAMPALTLACCDATARTARTDRPNGADR